MTEEYSSEVKNLQTELARKLSGNIAPVGSLKITWDQLLYSLSNDNPLSKAEIERISTIEQLFVVLMDKQFIDYGKYDKLEERLRPIHQSMASTVKAYGVKIRDQIKRDSKSDTVKLKTANEDNGGHSTDGGNMCVLRDL